MDSDPGAALGRRRAPATHDFLLAALSLVSLFAIPESCPAAEPARPVRFRESVAVETNLTAQRQLELARVQLSEKRWSQAFDLIRQVVANDAGSIVALRPGQYISVGLYAQSLLASMPPEGLAVVRQSIDGPARQAYEDALANHNDAALRALVRDSFVARATEDALFTLGQWAWESDDLSQARGWWERLVPRESPLPAGAPDPLLRYPDARLERTTILVRLAMCSIVEGNRERADAERQTFRKMFPEARGRLGGREGRLADLLDEVAAAARSWSFAPHDRSVSTFAVNAARNGILPAEIDVGRVRWTAGLPADPYDPSMSAGAAETLSLFPVVHKDVLFVNTADQIFAWDVRTGKPAWRSTSDDKAAIYPSVPEAVQAFGATQPVGAPQYTMTLADGRLYARMGAPITTRPLTALRDLDSQIVCLDVDRGEGKLVWKIDATTLDPQTAFEGTPLVEMGRAFVATTRGQPQTQTSVVCFDAPTGRRLWSRAICAAVADVGQNESLLSHQLLAAGDNAVFLSTGSGAIAAIEVETGARRWIVTYESRDQDEDSRLDPRRGPGAPCLFARNMVFAAPADCDDIIAVDSGSGTVAWRHAFRGGIAQLLGVRDDVLIASGRGLWGIDAASGRVVWHLGFNDPGSFGFGRGILAAAVVYWPLRDEIFVVEQQTGLVRRRIPLLARQGEGGGNLVLAGDALVVAEPQRIAVFEPYSGTQPARDGYSLQFGPLRTLLGARSRAWEPASSPGTVRRLDF